MNKNILRVMLILTVVFLTAMYVAKFFFPDWLVLTVCSPNVIKFGNYVDTHLWADIIATFICGFATYWLYCCACCGRWALKWWECLVILLVIGVSYTLWKFVPDISMHFDIVAMLMLPLIFKGSFTKTVITYTIHGFAQILSLGIRHIALRMPSADFASFLILGIDMYVWLVILYLFMNYNKKENKDGSKSTSILQ